MKHSISRLVSVLLIGMMLVGILFGCTGSLFKDSSFNLKSQAGRIIIGTTSSIRTLDPADAYEVFAGNVLYNTIERLYTYKSGSIELVPQLATALPKVSADGLTYTIPVRAGVKFHDRTDFNALAMSYSLLRFIKLGGAPSSLLADVVQSIKTNSLTELEIKLKRPYPLFPNLLAFTGAGAISPQVYEHEKSFLPNKIVGTGPYQLTQYLERSILRLDAFPDYWGERPANRGIDIQFLSSNANLLNAFKTGAVDIAYQTLSPNQIHNLEVNAKKNNWTVASNQGAVILYMVLNVQQPPLDNVKVRQAIAAAIDRPLLQSRVFQGQREPVYSLVPKSILGYKPVFQLYGDGNGKLARQLLTEAGYSDRKPAQVTLWYSPTYAGNGDLVVSTLKASIDKSVGKILQIKLEKVATSTAYAYLDKGAYPMFLLDWTPDIFDPDNFLQPFLACDQAKNNICIKGSSQYQGSFYNNPEINTLIAKQRQEIDPAKRLTQINQIQDILGRDVPFIPLWQNKEYAFAQSGINGVKIEPTQQLPYWTIHKL